MSFKQEFERDLARAQEGDTQAQRTVGNALLRGSVVPRDIDLGRTWLGRAIAQGDFEALRQLAAHDLLAGKLGRGPRAAWDLLQEGARLGDPHCAGEVARGIEHGLGLGDAQAADYFSRTGLPASAQVAQEMAKRCAKAPDPG